MKKYAGLLIFFWVLSFIGCGNMYGKVIGQKNITSFTISEYSGVITGNTITVAVSSATDVTVLTPTITYLGARISPEPGVTQNFMNPVVYTVTARDGSTQSYTVTVSGGASKILVAGVTINPTPATVIVLGTTQLAATLSPSNASIQTVNWTSSDPALATVDSNGLVSGKKVGTVTITAASTDDATKSSTCAVTINPMTSCVVTTTGSGVGATTTYTLPDGIVFATKDVVLTTVSATFPTGIDDNITTPIPAPFVMAETLTTYELWSAVYIWATDNARGTAKYTFANPGTNGSGNTSGSIQQPVTTINWRDAMVWCNALTEYYNANIGLPNIALDCVYYIDSSCTTPIRACDGAPISYYLIFGQEDHPYLNTTARGFRLPTSEEYEYAARYRGTDSTNAVSGYTSPYYIKGNSASGATASYMDDAATLAVAIFGYIYNGGSYTATGVTTTAIVKSKTANALGLYDMSGNAWEWCYTSMMYSAYEAILRGGSFNAANTYLAVGSKNSMEPDWAAGDIGFRFARNK